MSSMPSLLSSESPAPPCPRPAAPPPSPRPAPRLSIGIVGPGKVGQALLRQLRETGPQLRRQCGLGLDVVAVMDRQRLWLEPGNVTPEGGAAPASSVSDWHAFARQVAGPGADAGVIVDCSASADVADRYADWLAAGIHVVTPNKQAGAGELARYRAIRASAAAAGTHFRAEATVGAGLPVIQTLRDLLDTGDRLIAVEGILSGTLAWLFNRFDDNTRFSALVREAHALGYTEPDPRDDLSGLDVARKLVILAREAGLPLALADVAVEGLVPAALASGDRDRFLQRLADFDAAMQARRREADARGEVLRYVAELRLDGERPRASVGLVTLPRSHAFANLRLTDNVVQFTTRRYARNPLVVQGPGAGPEVTAAGVFADLLRVAASLGARL